MVEMGEEPSTVELATGGGVNVIRAALTAIITSSNNSLTFGRGVVDATKGYVLRDLRENLAEAKKQRRQVETREAVSVESITGEVHALHEALGESLDFIIPESVSLPGLFEKLSGLILNPTYVPGVPCLAAAPLLGDLLDVVLGKIAGGIDAAIAKVGETVWDFLLPAFGTVEGLTRDVESILADPITAALNWILGKQGQIDCPVDASLGAGIGVLETVMDRLTEALVEALP